MNTNNLVELVQTLQQLQQVAPAVHSSIDAWHIIAAGSGAAVIHSYHLLKDAGGIRVIWRNIWGSPSPKPPTN